MLNLKKQNYNTLKNNTLHLKLVFLKFVAHSWRKRFLRIRNLVLTRNTEEGFEYIIARQSKIHSASSGFAIEQLILF